MIDAPNLSKLLSHLPPKRVCEFLQDQFGVTPPEFDPAQNVTTQRKILRAKLSTLTVTCRQPIEEAAERIVCLTDASGRDVLEGMRAQLTDPGQRDAFDAQHGQYERSLWLFVHAQARFRDALDAREADLLRSKVTCYSGFVAPKSLQVAICDCDAKQRFLAAVAQHMECGCDGVAVQIFSRLRPDAESDQDVALFQVAIHFNRPPEIVDCVQSSEVVGRELVRADSAHITYDPVQGHLEVLSRDTDAREDLARLVADHLLGSSFEAERIPLKRYDYQCLSAPRTFDWAGEDIESVTVTELGYAGNNGRLVRYKVSANDSEGIHSSAKQEIGPWFDFRARRLTYARITIRTLKTKHERARTIHIVLSDENKCNVKTKREKDRALCDRLLARWGLLKDIGRAGSTVHAIAA